MQRIVTSEKRRLCGDSAGVFESELQHQPMSSSRLSYQLRRILPSRPGRPRVPCSSHSADRPRAWESSCCIWRTRSRGVRSIDRGSVVYWFESSSVFAWVRPSYSSGNVLVTSRKLANWNFVCYPVSPADSTADIRLNAIFCGKTSRNARFSAFPGLRLRVSPDSTPMHAA